MFKYILNSNPQRTPTGEREVHVAGCSQGPKESNQIDLGYHFNCASAIAAARSAYRGWHIDGCAYCVPACHRR